MKEFDAGLFAGMIICLIAAIAIGVPALSAFLDSQQQEIYSNYAKYNQCLTDEHLDVYFRKLHEMKEGD